MAAPHHRGPSFAAFILHDHKQAAGGGAVPTAWGRLKHSTSLLGYALFIAVFLTVELIAVQAPAMGWPALDVGRGVPVLNNWAAFTRLWVPMCIAFILYIYSSISLFNAENVPDHFWPQPSSGRKALLVVLVVFPPCLLLPLGLLTGLTDVDTKFYALDLSIFCFAFLSATIVQAILVMLPNLKRKTAEYEVQKQNEVERRKTVVAKGGSEHQQQQGEANRFPEQQEKDEGAETKSTVGKCGWWLIEAIEGFLPLLSASFIILAYPYVTLPSFFASGTTTRLLLALLLHPALLECAEALGRTNAASRYIKEIEEGKNTPKVARSDIIEWNVQQGFLIKAMMAFYRRMMLLNMGNSTATMVAIVAAPIEEALSRGFLVEIDTTLRRWTGKPELRGFALELQRLTWMVDANQSIIAEFVAIMMSSVMYIVMTPHALTFGLGYELAVPAAVGSIFVQLLLELGLEMAVDNAAMWAEAEHGIPMTEFFTRIRSPFVGLYHLVLSLLAMLLAGLFAFIRHPNVFVSNSADVCDCLDEPHIGEWFKPYCGAGENTTAGAMVGPIDNNKTVATRPNQPLSNSTSWSQPDNNAFHAAEPMAVLMALVTGLAMVFMIWLAVMFARYRKHIKAEVKVAAELTSAHERLLDADRKRSVVMRENAELKANLRDAQMILDKVMEEGGSALRQYAISYGDLVLGDSIGEGAFGTVYKAEYNGYIVAVKTIRTSKVNRAAIEKFKDEIKVMAPIHHANLVNMLGACWEDGPDKLALVLEFAANGSLQDLYETPDLLGSWANPRFKIALDVVKCLKYLHHELATPVMHRDIKPANILLAEGLEAKVADFGESRRFDEVGLRRQGVQDITMTTVGTPLYCAPEVIIGVAYNKSVDVYSFGMMLLTLVLGNETRLAAWFRKNKHFVVARGKRPVKIDGVTEMPPPVKELIEECWSQDPNKRPTFVEVYERLQVVDTTQKAPMLPYNEKETVVWDGAPAHVSADIVVESFSNEGPHVFQYDDAAEAGLDAGMAAQIVELKRLLAKNERDHRNGMLKKDAELAKNERDHRDEMQKKDAEMRAELLKKDSVYQEEMRKKDADHCIDLASKDARIVELTKKLSRHS